MTSIETIIDDAANIATVDGRWRLRDGQGVRRRERDRAGAGRVGVAEWQGIWSQGTDAVMDVPLGGVCEVLYGGGRDDTDGEDT